MWEPTICGECGVRISGEGPDSPQKWPFCPHGTMHSVMIVTDEIPGGVVVENYGKDPIKFYSHGERLRYMKEHGLRELDKFCPLPGTDKDPQGIPNPKGYMDPQTLENARILIERAQLGKRNRLHSDDIQADFAQTEVAESMEEVERIYGDDPKFIMDP